MRLLVVGASDCVGREIVAQAGGHGHEVVLFDEGDLDALRQTVRGCDAVIVASDAIGGTPGSRERRIGDVIYAMAEAGVRRLTAVSASGAFARSDRRLPRLLRGRIALGLRAVFDDLEAMERRIMASSLDWAIVRPVGLAPGPLTGVYRVALDGAVLPKASRVSCADAAALCLKTTTGETYIGRAVTVGY